MVLLWLVFCCMLPVNYAVENTNERIGKWCCCKPPSTDFLTTKTQLLDNVKYLSLFLLSAGFTRRLLSYLKKRTSSSSAPIGEKPNNSDYGERTVTEWRLLECGATRGLFTIKQLLTESPLDILKSIWDEIIQQERNPCQLYSALPCHARS